MFSSLFWQLVPNDTPVAIMRYLKLVNHAIYDLARYTKAQPIHYALVIDYANFERHANDYLASILGGPPLRLIPPGLHRQMITEFSRAVRFGSATKQRVIVPEMVVEIDNAYADYAAAMGQFNQNKHKWMVLPRMGFVDALKMVELRLQRSKWVGVSFNDAAAFNEFCRDEIYDKRQQGFVSDAIRMALSLSIVMKEEPSRFHHDGKHQLLYRTLVAFMGGWAAYQGAFRVMERYFVHELRMLHAQQPDISVKNRIRTHVGYHNKNYDGDFRILESHPQTTKSLVHKFYPTSLGCSLHNAASLAMDMGADLDTSLPQLGNRSPLAAFRESISRKGIEADLESELFSMHGFALALDRSGRHDEFYSIVEQAEKLTNGFQDFPVLSVRMQLAQGRHFARLYAQDKMMVNRKAANAALDAGIATALKTKQHNKANEMREVTEKLLSF